MECLMIPLFPALAALIWWAVKPFVVAAGWRRLAGDLHLAYRPGRGFLGLPNPGQIEGTYRGREVEIRLVVETVPHADGSYRRRFMKMTLGLRTTSPRRLVVQRGWHPELPKHGEGVELPDRLFAERYAVTVSDPADLAVKVFHDEGQRQRFHASIGARGRFSLNLEGRTLELSTRSSGWFLPDRGIEWRTGVLKAILDALVEVVEAAEQAPIAPWRLLDQG